VLSRENKPRRAVLDALFAHEVLRRIGIPAEEIYFAVNLDEKSRDVVIVTVVVKRNGADWVWFISKEPTVGGDCEAAADQLAKDWAEGLGFWNEAAVDAIDAWGYSEHPITNMSIQATLSLHQRGILDAPSDAARNILIDVGALPMTGRN
jgi:hypothetical protein